LDVIFQNPAAGSALLQPLHFMTILPLSSKELKNKEELEGETKKKRRKGRERKEDHGASSQGGYAHNHLYLHSWMRSNIPSPFFLKSPLKA